MESTTKRHSISVTISTLASLGLVLGGLWAFAKPWVAGAVADELKTQVEKIVDNKLAPINQGFRAIIHGNITALRQDIARLEYKRERDRDNWTVEDEISLSDLRIKIKTQQDALDEMTKSRGET